MTSGKTHTYLAPLIQTIRDVVFMPKPYTFINQKLQSYSSLRDSLVTDARARLKFDQLNAAIRNQMVMPGQLVIVGDACSSVFTGEERQLMTYAGAVQHSLMSNGSAANEVMMQNYDLLQSIMTYGSIGIGSTTGAWSKHLDEIKGSLKEIESLHQRWRSGALSKDQFIAQRQAIFSKLDIQLQGVGRFGTGLKNDRGIKKCWVFRAKAIGIPEKLRAMSTPLEVFRRWQTF
jgi:hypothetical protein